MEQYLKSIKVGFIGGGNMASAIGAGLIHKGNCTFFSLSVKINETLRCDEFTKTIIHTCFNRYIESR